ncbi:hypothetical protein OS493_029199 [Desmophyllum pertusum]|uniref:glycerophosphodiester phosphodiesterase n=1 Tax=Desmophyllum pertusum TaxID=174260 RepID=A0A9W9ZXX9_9CNID|nr:hypothetical protein OS493_029199 [Desmophyllum pertusum]
MEKLAMFLMLVSFATCIAQKPDVRPLNIGHRGSSGRLPEHTLAAYRLAIKEGADVIECDVSITKDLKLICRHESWLNHTTNLWEKQNLRSKLKTYNISEYHGVITDIFSVDLTLEEIKTIRVRQRYSFRDPNYNDMYTIPTLEEFIQVAKSAGRPVGIYPEVKNPEWVNSLDILRKANTTIEDLIVGVLHKNGYREKDSPCYVQSFSEGSIRSLATKTKLRLVMLIEIETPDPVIPEGKLKNLSAICYGIGVWKNMIIPTKNNYLQSTTNLVINAHKYNLKVHPYTFRNEDQYLAWNFTQDPYNEYQTFLNTHIDGYFTDFPGSLKKFLDMKYTKADPSPCPSSVPGTYKGGVSSLSLLFIAALSFKFFV